MEGPFWLQACHDSIGLNWGRVLGLLPPSPSFFFFVFIFLPGVAAAAAAIFQGDHAFLLSCCCCSHIAVASLRNSLEEWIHCHNFFFLFFLFLFVFQSQVSREGDEHFFSLKVEEWIRGHAIARSSCRLLQSAKNASSLWQLKSESGPRNCTIQLQASPEREERFFSLTVEEWIRGRAIARSGNLAFEILFAFHHSQTPRRLLLLLVNILRYQIERGCYSSINFSCSLNCCIQLD